MSYADPAIAVITDDPERFALVRRGFLQVAVVTRVFQVVDVVGLTSDPALRDPTLETHRVPHLIVLDDWPGARSVEALEAIRTTDALAGTRVVVLAAGEAPGGGDDVARAYRLGANSCLAAPGEPDALVTCMRQVGEYWLQLNRWPSW